MIVTHSLIKNYRGIIALRGVSVMARPGEITGLVGVNGAGKSTVVRILAGLTRPTSGSATIAGFDIIAEPIGAKRCLGYIPETPMLYGALSVIAFLDIVRDLRGLNQKSHAALRNELLVQFGLQDERHQALGTLSKGVRQRAVIVASLLHNPDVLVCDEPFDGLDVQSAEVLRGLLALMATRGKTILLCSHNLRLIEDVCSHVIVLHKGRVAAQGCPSDICAATHDSSLTDAFLRITGSKPSELVTASILNALERS